MSTASRPTDDAPAHACPGGCAVGEALSRRAFMEKAALAALGTMLAACGDGQFGPLALPSVSLAGGATIDPNTFPALASVGGIATTTVNGVPIAIGRTGASTYAVWSLVCPHQGQQVQIVAGGFHCPGHNATWNASGVWTGGQSTGNLTVIPSTFDTASGKIVLNGSGPTFEQDFTIDLTAAGNAALASAGGFIAVTKPIPNSANTTKIYIANVGGSYFAYGAACGHQGKYVGYNATLKHWVCPEHNAEFDMTGLKLKDATDNTNIPTGNLVRLQTTLTGTTLRIQGNSPPQGNP